MGNKVKQFNKNEKGQSLVELAVSLVALLILLAGVVDLGRAAFYYIAMRDAAQEGASFGSIYPNQCYAIEDRVRASLVDQTDIQVTINIKLAEGETASWSTVGCTEATQQMACEGNVVEVSVKDPDFPITMPFLGSVLGRQSIVLDTTIQDTIIRPFCTGN